MTGKRLAAVAAVVLASLHAGAVLAAPAPVLNAIGVENEYADVISQIGGKFVHVTAIETDPNTDPHTFEASPQIAADIANADLVVKNGLGYDAWTDKFLSATAKKERRVIDVQHLLALPDNTPNPHLWYKPTTMPVVAKQIAAELSATLPAQKAYFEANVKKFDESLKPWQAAVAAFNAKYNATEVGVTEPVGDYLLQAAGMHIATPWTLETAIMNGTDPGPQDVTTQNALLSEHKIKVFVYNQQVTDPLTQSFLALAKKNNIPVVGVYETMPMPGYTYQSWMLAETQALSRALADHVSTETLLASK